MGASLQVATNQAMIATAFVQLANKHGIEVDFDFSDERNPKVNFTGGTNAQQLALARELAEKFEEV